jgi:hypothetical protein
MRFWHRAASSEVIVGELDVRRALIGIAMRRKKLNRCRSPSIVSIPANISRALLISPLRLRFVIFIHP